MPDFKIRYKKCNHCIRTAQHEDTLVKLLKQAKGAKKEPEKFCFWCRLKTLKSELFFNICCYALCLHLIMHMFSAILCVFLYLSLAVYQIRLLDAFRGLFFGCKTSTFYILK